jgi:hypothetical protein
MASNASKRLSLVRRTTDSAEDFSYQAELAVARFGAAVTPALRAGVGQREASLTSPVEKLLGELADALRLQLSIFREAAEPSLGIRPDLAVYVDGAPVGVVELKAPDKGVPGAPNWGGKRNREQWEGLKALPNVLYSDGKSWAVYHFGERAGNIATLEGSLDKAGSRLRPKDETFAALLQGFLYWKPSQPRDLKTLIKHSAGLCHLLRDEVAEALRRERAGEATELFTEHLTDWQEWLFPDLNDAEFADAYAQTITFGLLLARREGVIFEGLEIPDIGEKLASRNLLVGRALFILTARPDRGKSMEERSIVLQTMRRIIGAADWTQWPAKGTYHWLYEVFLETYDPTIRRQMGVYYTPPEVTDFMVRFIDEVLREKLQISAGLADESVVVLDPAMGTGTFLQSVIDRVAEMVTIDGGDVPASLRDLLNRLIGFERQIGPYAVAELKLEQALEAHNVNARDEDFRLYVADTLDDPRKVPLPRRGRLYGPLAASRRAANHVKTDEDVMVVLGNPPYRTRAMAQGKWVLDKEGRKRSLLDDFREVDYGKYEYKLHDLAVYFWRWSLWKAFESTSDTRGIVAFITTSAYLDGPGFAGMRRYLREHTDFGWIIDLSPEGHWAPVRTRIFPGVPHPVCIGIFACDSDADNKHSSQISYLAIPGDQREKFEALKDVGVRSSGWGKCARTATASLRSARLESWLQYPAIDDLLPYTSLGVTCNRAWVRAPETEVLARRWRRLIFAGPEEKQALMKETRDRTIDKLVPAFPGEHIALPLRIENSPVPRIERIGFRSFDRQYLIADQRVVDFLRPDLWRLRGENQIFLVTQLREPLTTGPAVVFSAEVPDTHYFNGRGGRVIPLYRDIRQYVPNIAPGLLPVLRERLKAIIADDDIFAYIAGVSAHSGYTRRFRGELAQPGVRIPLTAVSQFWREAVEIGRHVIWLHTFGGRFVDERRGRPLRRLPGRPDVQQPIPGSPEQLPGRIEYTSLDNCFVLGWDQFGRIGPVTPYAAEYEISGMRVISHWFDYRKRNPSGRRGASDLDAENLRKWTNRMTEELRDLVAVLEGCVSLEQRQADLLDRIVRGPILSTAELTDAGVIPPPDALRRQVGPDDDLTLF